MVGIVAVSLPLSRFRSIIQSTDIDEGHIVLLQDNYRVIEYGNTELRHRALTDTTRPVPGKGHELSVAAVISDNTINVLDLSILWAAFIGFVFLVIALFAGVETRRIPNIVGKASRIPNIVGKASRTPNIVSKTSQTPNIVSKTSQTPNIVSKASKIPSIVSKASKIPSIVSKASQIPNIVNKTRQILSFFTKIRIKNSTSKSEHDVHSLSNVREQPTLKPDADMFRAYDIRGIADENLSPPIAKLIGHAIGSLMHEKNLHTIVVGRDGRLSGSKLINSLTTGLRCAGCNVIDIGMVPTPVVYFGRFSLTG